LLLTVLVFGTQLLAYAYDLVRYPVMVDRAAGSIGADAADVSAEKTASGTTDGIALVILVLCVGVLLLCVAGLRRGSPRARVGTLVTCVALLVCCGGVLLTDNLVPISAQSALRTAAIRLADASYPGWVDVLSYLGLLVYPLLLTATVLLLVPASTRFFRRPAYLVYLVPVDSPDDSALNAPTGSPVDAALDAPDPSRVAGQTPDR
jgi:hypothetical protein